MQRNKAQSYVSPRLSSSSAISYSASTELEALDDYVMFMNGHGKQKKRLFCEHFPTELEKIDIQI